MRHYTLPMSEAQKVHDASLMHPKTACAPYRLAVLTFEVTPRAKAGSASLICDSVAGTTQQAYAACRSEWDIDHGLGSTFASRSLMRFGIVICIEARIFLPAHLNFELFAEKYGFPVSQ